MANRAHVSFFETHPQRNSLDSTGLAGRYHSILYDSDCGGIGAILQAIALRLRRKYRQYLADEGAPATKTNSARLDGVEFVAALGRQMKTYWKIGIHWLTALLADPFDDRAIPILWNTS